MPRIAKRIQSREAAIFLILWIGLLVVGRERMFRDPGTFWHTTVGEQIIAQGSAPNCDEYSLANTGHPWIAQQWLGEIAMAILFRIGGLDGILVFSTWLIAFTFAIPAARLIAAGLDWPKTAILTLLTVGASSYHFLPRPHLATMLLMAVTFATLCDVESGRRHARRVLLLPLLMALWSNVHGGALGGLVTILLTCSCWIIRQPTSIGCKRSRFALVVGATAALSTIAVLMNPYGARLPATWLSLMTSKVLPELIIEHAPLRFATIEGVMILSLAGIYGLVLTRAWPGDRRITWLMPGIWFVLAVSRVRHGPLFAVTAAIAIADMLPHARLAWTNASHRNLSTATTRRGWLAFAGLLLSATLGMQGLGVHGPLLGQGWARLPEDYWPISTTAVINRLAAGSARPLRLFNDMLFGGYLIRHAPGAPVYIDDRCELYRDSGLQTYTRATSDMNFFDAMAHYENWNLALVQAGSPLDRHLAASHTWERLAADPASALYRRPDDMGPRQIAR